MASISLGQTYINLVSTGELVAAYTARGRTRTYQSDGKTEPFAGGRYRSITTEGVAGSQTFTLRDVTESQLATLISWIGETVLVRDNRGRRMFGTYYIVGYADRVTVGLYDVPIVFSEATYNEGA